MTTRRLEMIVGIAGAACIAVGAALALGAGWGLMLLGVALLMWAAGGKGP